MTITIDIQDVGDLTFPEVQDFLAQALADNGIDNSTDNVEITDADQQGDPNELEDAPLPPKPAPPALGGPGGGATAGPGGPTSATMPMSGAGPGR